jgi:hypothetical protein
MLSAASLRRYGRGMGYQWREDERANRLHCFDVKRADADEQVVQGAVALCGFIFDGVPARGMTSTADWRAVKGDRSICHDCNVKWERNHGVQT